MQRKLLWLLMAGLVLCVAGDVLLAQQPAAYIPVSPESDVPDRGPGFYLAAWKLILLWFTFLAWLFSTDRIGQDAIQVGDGIGMPFGVWNCVTAFSFVAVFLLAALNIPIFLIGYPVLVLSWFVPMLIYILQRNAKVTPERRIMTPSHIANWFKSFGKKQEVQVQVQPWEMGPKIDFQPVQSDAVRSQTCLIEARQNPAFVSAKMLVADGLEYRAERIMLDYTADAVTTRYYIDSVWQNANPKVQEKGPFDRAIGDQILAVLKKLGGLNVADRRGKQEGKIKVEYAGSKYDGLLQTQGTQTGERVLLTLTVITKTQPTLEMLGMREKMRESYSALCGFGQKGIFIFSSMPQDGLTSMWVAGLKAVDRLTRDFVSIQDEAKLEPDVENVEMVKYNSAAGETSATPIPKLLLKMPEVLCVPHIESGQTLGILADLANGQDKLNLISVRGKDCIDAIYRTMALQPEDMGDFARALTGVVYVRMIRRLCEGCREAFQPDPAFLQRLGIPPGKVNVLYREKQPLPPGTPPPPKKKGEPEVCPQCKGIGYRGRIGLFELVTINDAMRDAITKKAAPEVLRQLSRQAGNPTLQEEGVFLIAAGVTSIAEVQRVLKLYS
ncbi:MAG: ATPase, T2SS/T4P/T4SS family [Pirellulales bacterium]